ncbi:MAG TPA: GNAT family N-acetyltransferase [Kofleriaceae bacterium]|nr:GNAT family N-acetyltransferase [Kofleriaceae bacterium]
MTTIRVCHSLSELDEAEYAVLRTKCATPVFYDWRFLQAAERSPLLPVEKTFYLVGHEGGRLVAFMPAYLQSSADPFGVLSRTTPMKMAREARGLFSHIMHCSESTILSLAGSRELRSRMLEQLRDLALEVGASYYGVLNVVDPDLLSCAREMNLEVNYMWDRFTLELAGLEGTADLMARLPADGRRELRRQLRKFEVSGAEAIVERPPFHDFEEVARLCNQTTTKNGTPEYYPIRQMIDFITACSELVRLVSIKKGGERVGTLICFEQDGALHTWAAGMVYDKTEFSPYTLAFWTAFRYALEARLRVVEGGRTTAKIKQRLGFSPRPLYSIVSQTSFNESFRQDMTGFEKVRNDPR